jgi:gamma-glutamylcyclotransferase (GGCT)/AIG2-like uncharacterized protein YtfP
MKRVYEMGTYYFAYGSNLWFEQMKKRCPESVPISLATLSGWKLVFQVCPTAKNVAANILPGSETDKVFGAIYSITNTDVENLNKFEKIDLDYFHTWVNIEVNGQDFSCLTYQMSSEHEHKIPTTEYVLRLFKGYLNWDIQFATSVLEPYFMDLKEEDHRLEKSIVTKLLSQKSL